MMLLLAHGLLLLTVASSESPPLGSYDTGNNLFRDGYPRNDDYQQQERLHDSVESKNRVQGAKGWQGAVPGTPGEDYPDLSSIPKTSFSCKDKTPGGYYADSETRCQVFHVCDVAGMKNSFLCPSGSIFNQRYSVCDWWYDVQCGEISSNLQSTNDQQSYGFLEATNEVNFKPAFGHEQQGNSLNGASDLTLASTGEESAGYRRNGLGIFENRRRPVVDISKGTRGPGENRGGNSRNRNFDERLRDAVNPNYLPPREPQEKSGIDAERQSGDYLPPREGFLEPRGFGFNQDSARNRFYSDRKEAAGQTRDPSSQSLPRRNDGFGNIRGIQSEDQLSNAPVTTAPNHRYLNPDGKKDYQRTKPNNRYLSPDGRTSAEWRTSSGASRQGLQFHSQGLEGPKRSRNPNPEYLPAQEDVPQSSEGLFPNPRPVDSGELPFVPPGSGQGSDGASIDQTGGYLPPDGWNDENSGGSFQQKYPSVQTTSLPGVSCGGKSHEKSDFSSGGDSSDRSSGRTYLTPGNINLPGSELCSDESPRSPDSTYLPPGGRTNVPGRLGGRRPTAGVRGTSNGYPSANKDLPGSKAIAGTINSGPVGRFGSSLESSPLYPRPNTTPNGQGRTSSGSRAPGQVTGVTTGSSERIDGDFDKKAQMEPSPPYLSTDYEDTSGFHQFQDFQKIPIEYLPAGNFSGDDFNSFQYASEPYLPPV